jgi:chemosensory pili system protein ChpA (sensor histidine kinase/response regulator)
MDELAYPFDANSNELSADDLAVLEAFHAMDDLEVGKAESETPIPESPLATRPLPDLSSSGDAATSLDDMLVIFAMEAEEAIVTMRRALEQLEQDDRLDSPAFSTLQRTAHKLKGTAGSIGYEALANFARYIETLCSSVKSGMVIYMTGLIALTHTLRALELTLQGILTDGEESSTLLAELEEDFKGLNIDIRAFHTGLMKNIGSTSLEGKSNAGHAPSSSTFPTTPAGDHKGPPHHSTQPSPLRTLGASVQVDGQRLEELVQYAEQLVERQIPLENAQKEVEVALEELHAAQVRLRSLEALFSSVPFLSLASSRQGDIFLGNDELPMSSLVARILNEAAQRRAMAAEDTPTYASRKSQSFSHLLRLQSLHETALWDELEIDRYTENNLLAHSMSEAIADVATASGQLRVALAQFTCLVEQHMAQATVMRSSIHLLRSAPLSVLLPRLERAIQMSANAQQKQAIFEVKGETTEIDQDILEALANPLLQLVRNCADSLNSSIESNSVEYDEHPYRMWLHADAVGNEVTLEIGFSMTVQGGVLDALHEPIARLHGSISAQRNAEGGVSFHLRLPRSRGAVQGLLVRVGNSRVVVPFSQVLRIDYDKEKQYASSYVLSDLLNFPAERLAPETARPVLILQFNGAIQVDEILGNVELVMKPLAAHLQRPGIAGTAIDGLGNVLLILDVPELVKGWETRQSGPAAKALQVENAKKATSQRLNQRILVADDSVYIRQSLHWTLSHEGYTVAEARDGMLALEQLLENPPDLLLLDIEMPNLNGYDLLSIIRTFPLSTELAKPKIVMLTSRSSPKHRRRSLELGAHAYLTKPCPQDVMLETIASLLQ